MLMAMKKRNKEYLQTVLIAGGTFLGARLVKKGLEELWQKRTGKEVPKNPNDDNYSLKEVLAWAIATGIISSVTKVFLRWSFSAGSDKFLKN